MRADSALLTFNRQCIAYKCYEVFDNAGVGQGDVTPEVLDGLKDARRAGVHVVRASRVPGGTVIANGAIRDDQHDFVAADTLNPQKARVLLMLALTATDDRREIQRIFDQYSRSVSRTDSRTGTNASRCRA